MTVSILLFLPVVAALVVLFLKGETAKYIALGFAIAELVLAGVFLSRFVPDATTQFTVTAPWIPQAGIYFIAGIDGISMIMVLLTTLLVPLIILTTFKHQYKNASVFYALILFMQAGMLVVFTALDGFFILCRLGSRADTYLFYLCNVGRRKQDKGYHQVFIYTFAGSLFMLLGLIYLHMQDTSGTYDIRHFYDLKLDAHHQGWIFWAFFLAFAIKMPIFPFHTWQPDTYTEAPSAGTMMLSGIMLKMGIYGVIRWLVPIAPLGMKEFGLMALVLCIIGIVYASIIAFKQKDGKRLVAYSSIAHVGLIAAALFTFSRADGNFVWTIQGLQGALIQMLNHGINVVGLFFIWEIISSRLNTRDIGQLGGVAKVAPKFAVAFLIITLGTVALPLTNGFVGEFLLLNSVFQYNIWFAAIAGLTMIFGAVYMLRMYKSVMQGQTNALTVTFTDISGSEVIVLSVICILIIAIGIYPQPILHISAASVQNLVNSVFNKYAPTDVPQLHNPGNVPLPHHSILH